MTTTIRPTPTPTAAPSGAPHPLATLKALVTRGLRDNRRAPLTWGASLGAFCALIVAMWPSIEDSIGPAVENYPQALKEAFNVQELDSVEAYLDVEMFSLIVPLALAFFAIRCAIRLLVTAEEQRFLDTLLSAPVSRRVLAAASFAITALTMVAILAVIAAITLLAGVAIGVDPDAGKVAAGVANVWPLALFFAGLAILLAGLLHRPATVTAIASGTVAAMYVIDLVGKVAEPMEPFRYLSAFKYYGSAMQEGIDPAAFAGVTVAAAVLAAVGAVLFERRDVL
jgi:ABC-2 type transport system permease protein